MIRLNVVKLTRFLLLLKSKKMDPEERLSNSSSWEEECVDAAECELNALEKNLAAEREENSQRIWMSFQNAANAVAQLFRGLSASTFNKYGYLNDFPNETWLLCHTLWFNNAFLTFF